MPDYDPRIVDLYDADNPDGPDHDFYRALADDRAARSILDLGCGTGILTVTLASPGRRVVGIDPSRTMLTAARSRDGAERVTWIEGDSTAIPAERFDLALMTGNVAQHIPDVAWARTLDDLRSHMVPGGVLSFESRNPAVRAWESWNTAPGAPRETEHGTLTAWMDAALADDRIVTLREHRRFARRGRAPETITQEQTLTFRSRTEIEDDLRRAGFKAEQVHGTWDARAFEETDALMIVVARAC